MSRTSMTKSRFHPTGGEERDGSSMCAMMYIHAPFYSSRIQGDISSNIYTEKIWVSGLATGESWRPVQNSSVWNDNWFSHPHCNSAVGIGWSSTFRHFCTRNNEMCEMATRCLFFHSMKCLGPHGIDVICSVPFVSSGIMLEAETISCLWEETWATKMSKYCYLISTTCHLLDISIPITPAAPWEKCTTVTQNLTWCALHEVMNWIWIVYNS